jgi:hypothetical protein
MVIPDPMIELYVAPVFGERVTGLLARAGVAVISDPARANIAPNAILFRVMFLDISLFLLLGLSPNPVDYGEQIVFNLANQEGQPKDIAL